MNDRLPPAPVNQPLLFQRLRWRLVRNAAAVALERSWLRLLTILVCSALIWAGVYAVSFWGFGFLQRQHIPFAGGIVATLFDFLFLSLAFLLVFSSGLILYSSLFAADETAFLLSTPAAADQVFAFKYQAAVAFSSWAFLLLGSPLLIAYGVAFGVPWYFYGVLVLFFLGFVLLPSCAGALLCLLVVNCVPRRRKQLLVAAGLAVLAGLGWWVYGQVQAARADLAARDLFQRLLDQFAVAQGPLVPSHWMTRGLQAAARGDLVGTAYYLALVWSNGLFLYVCTAWAAARLYRRGYNRVATGGTLRRRYGGAWLDRALVSVLPFLDPQTQLLIVKDFRTFRRDPAQWAQVLIFTGLLTLYFANLRRFYLEDIGRAYQNGISLLNLAATALLLCSYTGRFIFPMLSLEGRKFWILGLLPLRRERLLWGKFAFAATGAVLIAEFLVVLSDLMLNMTWLVVGLHALTVAVLAVGLSGLSVGLGACLPNFQEGDPSKIAVGFGGTLNLVVGLLFLLLVIGLMAAPWHLYTVASGNSGWPTGAAAGWLAVGVAAGVALGAAAVVVPLRAGARALRQMEF